MSVFHLEGTSVGPLISTKSNNSLETSDIIGSKILYPICQIWWKLPDLAEIANAKISMSRKRQKSLKRKKKLHSVSLSSLNESVQSRRKMGNCHKLFKQGQIEVWLKSWVSINRFCYKGLKCPTYFYSKIFFRCFSCLCLHDVCMISLMHVKHFFLSTDVKWNYTLTIQARNNSWDVQVPEGKLFIGKSWTNFPLFLALQCWAICSH